MTSGLSHPSSLISSAEVGRKSFLLYTFNFVTTFLGSIFSQRVSAIREDFINWTLPDVGVEVLEAQ